ncbi:glucosaminidase domain-containing protein [Companilactobacillus zhongbaensis]|uniref:glucosaminidase domain-containing protein n=1 Tax=Companilactobacillus zhongbaensis TaxID=2486009 RepID=UPI000F7B9AC4|nr:glucosaminidase domain-containing protein [Companilactobacillus zhongbaensis]
MRKSLLLTSVAILNTMASVAVPTVVSASTTDSTSEDTTVIAADQNSALPAESDAELVGNNGSKDNNILEGSKKIEPDQNIAHSTDIESFSEAAPMSRMSSSAFIDLAGPMAQKSAQRYNVYASVMMAQAIIESGWGGSTLAMYPNHNLFGIKGSYNGQSVYMPTREYSPQYGWYTINAAFRKYPSYEQSFDDNGALLRYGLNGYYKGTWKENTNSYRDATRWLQGRYATAPNYAAVLNNVIDTYGLTRFDNAVQGPDVDAGSEAPLNGDFFKMDDVGVITNPNGAQIYHQANPDRPEKQILAAGSSWKTTGKVVTSDGKIFYQVSTTQYIKADDIKLKSDVSEDTKQRVIKAKNPNSSIVPLVGFKENGKTFDGNRGLSNDTLWITDQTREYQGHKYYRVSTNEWVQDSHATFIK